MITLLFNTLATCKSLTFAPLLIHTRILGYLIRNISARQNHMWLPKSPKCRTAPVTAIPVLLAARSTLP